MVEVISFDYILGKKIGCWQNWYSAKHTTNQGESLLLPFYLKKNVSNTLAFHQSVPLERSVSPISTFQSQIRFAKY